VPLVRNLADGPDAVTKAVRTNLKHGADFIKILATGAVLSNGISPGSQQYSDAEIQAAVTEARRWGRHVAAHAHGTEGIKAAIRAGVRTIDHGSMLDAEAVAMLKGAPRTTCPRSTPARWWSRRRTSRNPRRSASGRSATSRTPASAWRWPPACPSASAPMPR
jgi:imidazolonepropionase-like amidohydrolase